MDDDGIGKQVRGIIQISCINLSPWLKCNEMQSNCTLQIILNIPIIQLPRSQNTDLESLLKHYQLPKWVKVIWFAKTVTENLEISLFLSYFLLFYKYVKTISSEKILFSKDKG